MLHLLISVAGIILTIFFVVGTHEAGHFIAARLAGVKVLTFSIGFGRKIFSRRDKSGTEYIFAWIPLGGYVRMLDESEGVVKPKEMHLAYNNQPFYKKFIIVLAGPLTNFICAFILYWLIFTLGIVTIKPVIGTVTPNSIAADAGLKPMQEITSIDQQQVKTWTNVLFKILAHTGSQDQMSIDVKDFKNGNASTHSLNLAAWKMDNLNPDPLLSLGMNPYEPPIKMEIGYLREGSPAAKSGLKLGDKLVAINQQKIKDWLDVQTQIQSHPDQTVTFTIIRNNKKIEMPVTIGSQRDFLMRKTGMLGIGPEYKMPDEMLQRIQYNPLEAIPKAVVETYEFAKFNLLLFGKMITGKLSLKSIGGPITIFDTAGDSLNYGFLPFISFLAFLSVSLGVINLFPIPGLDGGHLLLQMIEAITRHKIPEHIMSILFRLGFLFLMLVMIQALVNDVLRLF